MSTYTIPSTRSKSIQDRINQMADVFERNVDLLVDLIVTKGLANSGLISTKVSKQNIIQLMDSTIIPQMHSWESSWIDNPTQPDKPSMKGVSLDLFTTSFNSIFIDTDITEVADVARSWNTDYPFWRSQPEFSKVLLSLVCGRPKLAALYVYYVFSSQDARYPIAVMTEDPWLGFLLGQSVWSSNYYVYDPFYMDFSGVATRYGWNGLVGSWVVFIQNLNTLTPQFALDCFLNKYNYIRKMSKPEGPNAIYRNAWLERLVNSDRSDLMLLIKITETFCLNVKRNYDLSENESQHLMQKASSYKQMELKLPD